MTDLELARERAEQLWPNSTDDPVRNACRDAFVAGAQWAITPTPCDMKRGEPYDFAWCDSHDTTFPLGGTCKFDGRDPVDVYADEADDQRVRAVRAEMRVEAASEALSAVLDTVQLLEIGALSPTDAKSQLELELRHVQSVLGVEP